MIKHFKHMIIILFSFLILVGCSEETIVPRIVITSDEIVKVGDTLQLRSNLDVEWMSMDIEIATISQTGLITGVAEGIATIKATLISNPAIFMTREITVIASEGCGGNGGLCPTISYPEPRNIEDVTVQLGIDRIDEYLHLFAGKNVGLITNQTGFNSELRSTIDILNEKTNLVALFAPEHGIRGELQAGASVSTYTDEKTGIIVYSLYGSTMKPTPTMLANIDILCIDIQDAGARFYTYVYTMSYAMEACSENGVEFLVFDRPNPASGAVVEGNILDTAYSSFIGRYPIVQRHGMTIAELAYLFNEEFDIDCDLKVILMDGWGRYMYYDDTNLPWVIPSPNFPTVDTAVLYPGTCIFEGTNLSEGRGTTVPFQVIGAPFIDANDWADALNALELPGVVFRPAYFTPTFSKHTNTLCKGVQVHVTDRSVFEAVKTGWAMLEVVRTMYPTEVTILNASTNRNMLDLLSGGRFLTLRTYTMNQLFDLIETDTATFSTTRSKYLLYIEASE